MPLHALRRIYPTDISDMRPFDSRVVMWTRLFAVFLLQLAGSDRWPVANRFIVFSVFLRPVEGHPEKTLGPFQLLYTKCEKGKIVLRQVWIYCKYCRPTIFAIGPYFFQYFFCILRPLTVCFPVCELFQEEGQLVAVICVSIFLMS